MNELITNAEHIHYILSKALIRYYDGKQLTNEEEQVLGELYEIKEEGYLPNINGIKQKPNIHLKFLIMSGVPGMHKKNKDQTAEGDSPVQKYPLDEQILSIEGKTFPETGNAFSQILEIIQKGGDLNDVYKYCQEKILEKPLILRHAYRWAIINYKGEKGKERDIYQDFNLLKKFHENIPLTFDELALIKEAVKKAYVHPEIVGFVFDKIEAQKK